MADSRTHEGRRSAHLPSHEIKIREDPRDTGPVSRRAWPGSGEGLEREGSLGAVDGNWSGLVAGLVGKQQRAGALLSNARRGHAAAPFHHPCRVGCSVDATERAVESGREDVVDSQILANC